MAVRPLQTAVSPLVVALVQVVVHRGIRLVLLLVVAVLPVHHLPTPQIMLTMVVLAGLIQLLLVVRNIQAETMFPVLGSDHQGGLAVRGTQTVQQRPLLIDMTAVAVQAVKLILPSEPQEQTELSIRVAVVVVVVYQVRAVQVS